MHEGRVHGKVVDLRPATPRDQRVVFEWATIVLSDINDDTVAWEKFRRDHPAYLFDGSRQEMGRCYIIEREEYEIGQVYYLHAPSDANRRVELHIWMRAEEYCGKGFGSAAILTLCEYLARQRAITEFVVHPEAKNVRAVRSYEKLGFVSQQSRNSDVSDASKADGERFYMLKTVGQNCAN
jgi:RimJ/RimL family protein N-acetyltransferase